MHQSDTALVLFSGGQDSTTCVAWALERYARVETIGFAYGQRHAVELAVRPAVLAGLRALKPAWDARLGEDHMIDLSLIGKISDTALTSDVEIAMQANGLPNTFVPGRNLMFMMVAATLAYRRGLTVLVGGMCETDFSGYPDCRDDTMKALQVALNLGMATRLKIETPLMWIDKKETWQLAQDTGGPALVDLVRTSTHTCYLGERGALHPWGYGCGTCPACELRARGYQQFVQAGRSKRMRIALLTDLHANREALDACLAHAARQGADKYAFTGDLVGYGGDPASVLDTVMEHAARGAIVVKGNHDEAASRGPRPGMHAEAREVIEWTRGQLGAEQLAFLDTLQLTSELGSMMFVHASAHEPQRWEYVTGLEEAERSLRASHSRMVFSGHVHAPALYRRADDGRMGAHTPRSGVKVRIEPRHQYLVIPGSVGQPRDGNCAACYAMFDDEKRELTYFRIPYDHGAAARRVIAQGLPIVFAMRLVEGI